MFFILVVAFGGALSNDAQADDFERSLVPFTWIDASEKERARRLDSVNVSERAFVQRMPSQTSRVFELLHGDKELPATFEGTHHGLMEGSIVKLPVCAFKGRLYSFQLRNSDLIPRILQDKFADVRSYHAFEVGGTMSAEISVGPEGIRAQIWAGGAGDTICYIDPHTVGRADKYTVYSHVDPRMKGSPAPPEAIPAHKENFFGSRRLFDHESADEIPRRLLDASFNIYLPPAGQQSYRTYRICVAVSPDYLTFAESRSSTAMSMLTATFTRANGIWRRAISISLQFCDVQDMFFKTRSQGNNIPNGNPSAFLDSCTYYIQGMGVSQSQYDMAHYISASGGGGLGACCACESYYKCMGGTALPEPTGDPFDVDYVAHEMGHQFNHLHTFAGSKGNCGSNFYEGESVELGSGRTILSYAGICDTDNTQMQASPYFASVSLGIYSRTQNDDSYQGGVMRTCGTVTQTSNNRPTATTLATCAVPRKTPFVLKGIGFDADANTVLTYNWEQIDAATKATPLDTESKDGPLFVSVTPSTEGHTRYFPAFSTVIKNRGTSRVDNLERLSTNDRDLHFTMTVRDRYNGPGGGAEDTAIGTWHLGFTTASVSKAGPLTMISLSSPEGDTSATAINDELQTGAWTLKWRLLNFDSTDSASSLIKNADFSIEAITCTSISQECTSTPDWIDAWGDGCLSYGLENWCTSSGAPGSGWSSYWGEMDVVPPNGPVLEKPSVACCACGGGKNQAVCSPGSILPLNGFDGSSSWKMNYKGRGQATVEVPSSLAGSDVFFRVISGSSTDTMTEDVYCKYYTITKAVKLKLGVVANITVSRTIPADGATDVPSNNLEVVLFMSRASSLSSLAAEKSIVVRNASSGMKTIAGNSNDLKIEGTTVIIIIGDVGSHELTVEVPDFLIKDLPAQTITFTTHAQSVDVAPTIVSVTPTSGSVNVLQDSFVNITLSDDALPGSGSVHVRINYNGDSELLCSVPAREMTFAHNSLSFNLKDELCWLYSGMATYVEIEKSAVFNPMGGLNLTTPYTFSFEAWVDTVAPQMTGSHPLNNARNITEDDWIIVYYDEDVYAYTPGVHGGGSKSISIIPRESGKYSFSISVLDTRYVQFFVEEAFVGAMEIYPEYLFQPRTTYDVIIPAGAVEDWNYNLGPAHSFTFTTGDSHGPYCDSVTGSQAGGGNDLVITMVWADWSGQVEPSRLAAGKSGKFWLKNVADPTDVVDVPVTDSSLVQVNGLIVTIAFSGDELIEGASYTFRWPDNILHDDYDNPVFKWSHSSNDWCNDTLFTALESTTSESTTPETTTPESTTPVSTTPDSTTPAPESTVLETTVPESTTESQTSPITTAATSASIAVDTSVAASVTSVGTSSTSWVETISTSSSSNTSLKPSTSSSQSTSTIGTFTTLVTLSVLTTSSVYTSTSVPGDSSTSFSTGGDAIRVRGSMTITVSDPASFASNDAVKTSLRQAIADNHANLETAWVKILSVSIARRLNDSRRLNGNVLVDYQIDIPASAAVATPTTESMQASQTQIASSLNILLSVNGVVGIIVTSVVASEVVTSATFATSAETSTSDLEESASASGIRLHSVSLWGCLLVMFSRASL